MRGLTFITAVICALLSFVVSAAIPDWTPPLSTRGRYIVDANGNRFKLKSGNWHGASGTWEGSGDVNIDSSHHASKNSHNLPLGLQYVHIDAILDSFEEYGINSIRLPFSNEMIHNTATVQSAWVQANPQLLGKTPIQVYDAVIQALTARRFAVILNNHTNRNRWCCGVNDGNERWDKSQSAAAWADDWLFMVRRYQSNARVVGADLYNEVRRDILNDPSWGPGGDYDWYSASQLVGDRILAEANSNLLIMVEGINWIGLPIDGFTHGRPTLEPTKYISHTLLVSNKLVYSAHFYSYTGPNHSGASGIGETTDPRYRDFSKADLFAVMQRQASFVALDSDAHYVAPLWLSEFGIARGSIPDNDRAWWINTIDYLVANDIDFAVWPLVGYLTNGGGNGWALFNWDTAIGKRDGLHDGNDWRASTWDALVTASSRTGQIPAINNFKMLNMDNGDAVQSLTQRRKGDWDWDNGARKAMCPDGLRLVGMANVSRRGLCSNAVHGDLWASDKSLTPVWDERYVDTDWASGYTKYQCPENYFAVGYAMRDAKVSTVLCAKAAKSLGKGGTTVWFDKGDNRRDGAGGDFAINDYKGSCARDEYVAGVAFTTRIFDAGRPSAILCRK